MDIAAYLNECKKRCVRQAHAVYIHPGRCHLHHLESYRRSPVHRGHSRTFSHALLPRPLSSAQAQLCYRDTSTANRKTQQAQNDLNPPRSTSALIPCTRLLLYPRAHASIGRASRDQTCPPVTKPSRDLVDESARAHLSPVRRTLRADHNGSAAQSAQRDGAHRERAHPSRARPQGRL